MENKEAYVEKMKAQLDQWNAKLDVFKAKTREAKADAKVHYEEELESLRHRRDELKEKISGIEKAAGSAWQDLREGAEESMRRLKSAIEKARSKFH